jgi:4-amino-4-deoxy-L-arabinose transferase-like glycosyltransferase
MDLCAVRSFVSRGTDAYSPMFWVHPPVYPLLISLCSPLSPAFAERAEMVSILLGIASLVVLYCLNRRLYGFRIAALSASCFAIMSGAVFFGVWVKRDQAVVLTGLSSLLTFAAGGLPFASLLLGTAFLTKLSALYFVPAALFPLAAGKKGLRRWTHPITALAIVILTSAWWYLKFDVMGAVLAGFAFGTEKSLTSWSAPATYWPQRLLWDLGGAGCVWLAAGFLCFAWQEIARRRRREPLESPPASPWRYWPFLMLVPSACFLLLARGKAPWMIIGLYPAIATVQAFGVSTVADTAPGRIHSNSLRKVFVAAICALSLVSIGLTSNYDFALNQERLGFGQQWGAMASREAAVAVNSRIKEGERLLITRFAYWGTDEIRMPCPVFAYYLRNVPVFLESFRSTPAQMVDSIRRNRIGWALLSPPHDEEGRELLRALVRQYGLVPIPLQGAVLFKTSSLWEPSVSSR